MQPVALGRFLSHSCALLLALAGARTGSAQSSQNVLEYANPTVVQRLPESALRLTLGGADGMEFHRIVTILPLTRGGFVVVNGGTSELRFFDESGRLRSTVGRSGRGPGEYVGIRDAGLLPGDTLVVFDPGARRISILNPDGAFARSFPLQAPFEGGGSATRMVALRDGTVMVGYSEIRQMAPQPTPMYFGQRLFAYSTMGALRSPNGVSLPESEHFVQVTRPERGGVAYWDLAFGRVMALRADSSSLLVGDGSDWSVQLRGADGTVLRTHRLRRAVLPVSASDKDAYREAALAGSQGPERVITEKMVAEMPYPKTKPAFRWLESDGAGRVWIEPYPEASQNESIWIRLAPSTRTAIAVAFPPRFRPLAFTAHLAYGIWRDADDVEHVRLYSLDGL